jgi:putative tryptophan/tyrosine transport system substrate-binding protein
MLLRVGVCALRSHTAVLPRLRRGCAALVLSSAFAAIGAETPIVAVVANTIPMAQWSASSISDGTPHPGQAIRDGLEKLGWIDGQNVRLVWRSAEGRFDRLPAIFNELAAAKVDVIVAIGPGVDLASKATRTIPVVMVVSAATLGPWVKSLARPDSNLTGLTVEAEGQESKRLELLKRTVPTATRVALLEEQSGCSAASKTLTEAAGALGLTLTPVRFRSLEQLEHAFAQAVAMRAEAVLVCDGVWVWRHEYQRLINALALHHRLPIMHTAAGGADTGGLLAYGVDMMVQYRRVPHYIDRLLKGAKPADLPIEQPKALEFAVNLQTARKLGLQIPASILIQADRVID